MLFVRYIVVLEPFNIISVVLVLMSMLRFSLWSCVDRSNDIGASDVWNCVLCVGWACVSVLHVCWNVCTRVFVCDRVCVCVCIFEFQWLTNVLKCIVCISINKSCAMPRIYYALLHVMDIDISFTKLKGTK